MSSRFLLLIASLLSVSLAIHVSVKNGDKGTYCILLDSDVTGTVDYYNTYQNKTVSYDFAVNGTVTSKGNCFAAGHNETVESIAIDFLPNDITPIPPPQQRWQLHLEFANPKGQERSFVISDYKLRAVFYKSHFNTTVTQTTVYYTKPEGAALEWFAADTHGFTCSKASLALTNDSSVQFANLKVVAFAMFTEDKWPQSQLFEQCKLDVRTSDLVPIIVGACLAGLVIVVLIAYLIGRARAKRQGYASV
ncbi:lysosome-associated membrane glycoprotein (Lamp) domain-containing protein [Ditylenchus destructor]|uniref:Lysosome-associated membrane glycoprotein (Lamp) domain-containing protein n=1 Tax=Ditylenchus destructor TaxID=166010 RepID=A0AAD4R1S5_9BILA|nr:lysosome-associated membrane glycoprotein (Lamp) domain-containing protein [Ditylenchus destructor]